MTSNATNPPEESPLPQKKRWIIKLPLARYSIAFFLSFLAFLALGGDFLDIFFLLRSSKDVSKSNVTVVLLDDATFHVWDHTKEPEEWKTTPRPLLATLIDKLDKSRAITLDILMDSPQPGDCELAKAIEKHGSVAIAEHATRYPYGGQFDFVRGTTLTIDSSCTCAQECKEKPPEQINPNCNCTNPTENFLDQRFMPVSANLLASEPYLFSRSLMRVIGTPLLKCVSRRTSASPWLENSSGHTQERLVLPSMSLASAALFQGITPNELKMQLDFDCPCENLPCPVLQKSLKLGRPEDFSQNALRLNYRGRQENLNFQVVSAADILLLHKSNWEEKTENKIVLIGRADQETKDRHTTVYDFPTYQNPSTHGVFIQAQLIDQLLQKSNLSILRWPWQIPVLLLSLLAIFLSYPIFSVRSYALFLTGLAAANFGFHFLLFDWGDGIFLDPGPSILTIITVGFYMHFVRRKIAIVALE